LKAGNGAAMVLMFEEAELFNMHLEPWTINIVESDEANKRD
jgi:hypothetical protein